ncbi:MAG: phosphate signaling complex protein PhoU [Deltaproteobacteria bacterium]|nr:phosphate signaling complex protein PhoU [Deltaproteobacteria bacterium]
MPAHTDRNFASELRELKESILTMGSMVETMIARSTEALIKRNSNEAREVINTDRKVDELEMHIDNLCLKILALHQPAAADLRFVAMGMKISTDLERMGDLANNICKWVLELNEEEALNSYMEVTQLAEKAQKMVKDSLDSFVRRDAKAAQLVCEADDIVDQLNYKLASEFTQIMEKDPKKVGRGLKLILICRQLERIGDHATNVAEEVKFMIEGEDIRHGG